MTSYYRRNFWVETSERAIKSAGQAALLFVGADQFNVLAFDWATLGGFALGGAVLSILTSVASAPIAGGDTPSVV